MGNAFAIDFVTRTLAIANIRPSYWGETMTRTAEQNIQTHLQYAIEDMNNNAWEGVLDLLFECIN